MPRYIQKFRKPIKIKLFKLTDYQLLRLHIAEIDKYHCQMCYRKKAFNQLHIHHIIKRKHGGLDEKENLISLCRSCHQYADRWNLDREEIITFLSHPHLRTVYR